MTDSIAIRVENLSKRYRIGQREAAPDTLTEAMLSFITRPYAKLRKLRGLTQFNDNDQAPDIIWALKDVSCEVKRGEVVGIIGRNGAGKSTLLKILSRVTHPTRGQIELNGRLTSLLEVGTGFHPELTGRENIYLKSSLLGMKKTEIDCKFDEIVDFSGVERFIDTPVKRYSSGMRARLGFSVAAHLEPEIMIVDEVLSVGDASFRRKSHDKMRDAAQTGKTVLFVSHNMAAISSLCQRVLVLHNGNILLDGQSEEAIRKYLSLTGTDENLQGEMVWEPSLGSDHIQCRCLRLRNESEEICDTFLAHEKLIVELEYKVLKPLDGFRFRLVFNTEQGETAFVTTDYHIRTTTLVPGYYRSRCVIPPDLFNQRQYTLMIGGGLPDVKVHIRLTKALSFQVLRTRDDYLLASQLHGVLAPKMAWLIDQPIKPPPILAAKHKSGKLLTRYGLHDDKNDNPQK